MKDRDLILLKQLKSIEKKSILEITKTLQDLNKFSIIIGMIHEESNDIEKVDVKFKDLEKGFKKISSEYHSKRKKLLKLQANKRLILDNLYKKYPPKEIEKELEKL